MNNNNNYNDNDYNDNDYNDNNYDYNNDNNDYENNNSYNNEYNGGKRKCTRKNNMYGGYRMLTVGSKAQVWHGTAKHTSGGLTRKDLMKTKKGRVVSRKKHAAGKKALKNLVKAGFKAKKGTFKLFRK